MKFKTCLLIVMLAQLTGCVVTPRIHLSDNITFDALQPEQKPLSYNDTLCCWRCSA